MSRRRAAEKREVLNDPKFDDRVVTKFMNSLMYAGKKSIAEGILYGAFNLIQERAGQDPLKVFHEALDNVRPALEGALAPGWRRDLSGAGRGSLGPRPSAGDSLADQHRARPLGADHDRAAVGGIPRCREQSRHRREKTRRHPPHGRGQ